MLQLVCDFCAKAISPGAAYITLKWEAPSVPTLSDSVKENQFCSMGCVAKHAAVACGWEVNNGRIKR